MSVNWKKMTMNLAAAGRALKVGVRCWRCGELATREEGDWSGSSFVCDTHSIINAPVTFMSPQDYGPISQTAEVTAFVTAMAEVKRFEGCE